MPEGGGGNVQGGVEREDGGNRAGGGGEVSCGVKLWETCAREWGDGRVRRGDVVLLESESVQCHDHMSCCFTTRLHP